MDEENKIKSGMHVSALVLGIVSMIFGVFWYISIPAGILAIVFGAKSARRLGSKMGKAGMILGIIGMTMCVFMYFSMIAIILVSRM